MKLFKNISILSLLASILILTNCGPNDPDGKDDVDALKEQATKLVHSWTLTANQAKLESDVVVGWNGLELEFTGDKTGGSFTTNKESLATADGVTTEVWPVSGDWSFKNDGSNDIIGTIVRDSDDNDDSDGVEMDVTVTQSTLTLVFTIGDASRSDAVDGTWTFRFER